MFCLCAVQKISGAVRLVKTRQNIYSLFVNHQKLLKIELSEILRGL